MELSERFNEAFLYASYLHNGQTRKSSPTPYISHLLGVTALVLQHGGDEDQAMAALLHDAVEDQGGLETLEEIRFRFGERVARIVDGCTDSYLTPKKPWLERKRFYIQRLAGEPEVVRLVSLADKVDNARAILMDLRKDGSATWSKFKGGKGGTLWYYRALANVFSGFGGNELTSEFLRLVEEMEGLAKAGEDV